MLDPPCGVLTPPHKERYWVCTHTGVCASWTEWCYGQWCPCSPDCWLSRWQCEGNTLTPLFHVLSSIQISFGWHFCKEPEGLVGNGIPAISCYCQLLHGGHLCNITPQIKDFWEVLGPPDWCSMQHPVHHEEYNGWSSSLPRHQHLQETRWLSGL
jgi:hypothetical protein